MQPALSSNWVGTESSDLAVLHSEEHPPIKLQRPSDDAGPCSISASFQSPLVPCQLLLCSSARMVEVSVQHPGDSTLSYLQTTRCQPQGDCYAGSIDLQGAVGCSRLQLKLLSLQGDKTTCTIRQLHFQQAAPPAAAADSSSASSSKPRVDPGAPDVPAAAAAAAADAGSCGPIPAAPQRTQALSQRDELRILIQQLQQPGPAGGGGDGSLLLPESLQLLHSKATAAPQSGAGTAMRNLSAHIAQGMLFQAAQQRAQQQQQQHTGEQQLGQRTSHQQQQQLTTAGQADSTAGAPAQQGSSGTPDVWLGCLAVLQRLEAKVDRLADSVSAGLQQLDQRLARLEAAAAGLGAAA